LYGKKYLEMKKMDNKMTTDQEFLLRIYLAMKDVDKLKSEMDDLKTRIEKLEGDADDR